MLCETSERTDDNPSPANNTEKIIAAVSNRQFQKKARNAGFNPQPMGAVETAKYIKEFDEMLYPVLLSAGLVKVRHK